MITEFTSRDSKSILSTILIRPLKKHHKMENSSSLFLGAFVILCTFHICAASILQTPYLATVEVNGEAKCTGAIIDDSYIITSQACTNTIDMDTDEVYVRVGTGKLGFRGSVLKAVNILPDDELGTDLALVQVANFFEFSTRIMWANPNSFGITEGLEGVIGVWASDKKKSSLLVANVTVINTNTCAQLYAGIFNINSTVTCVMPKVSYKKSCLAHLGAPMYLNEQVYGVVTYNPGCTNDTLPLVVTMLGGYTSYVISKMCGVQNIMA